MNLSQATQQRQCWKKKITKKYFIKWSNSHFWRRCLFHLHLLLSIILIFSSFNFFKWYATKFTAVWVKKRENFWFIFNELWWKYEKKNKLEFIFKHKSHLSYSQIMMILFFWKISTVDNNEQYFLQFSFSIISKKSLLENLENWNA